ncbi:fimbrial protein [Escherichia coli]|nr:fimbrial protein [Escherichia coli]
MKKALIALVVASSVVSWGAHAWTNGDFNGTVNIGGNIANDIYSQKWAWSVGSGLDGFSHKISDMTDAGKKLVITLTDNKAILLGKTTEAFWAPGTGVGAVPNISFTDYKGATVTLSESGTNGVVSFSLPIKDSSESEVGQLRVNAVAVGYMATGASTVKNVLLNTMYADSAQNVFFGGVQKIKTNAIQSGKAGASKVADFGGVTLAELVTQLNQVHSNIQNSPLDGGYVAVTDWTRPSESAMFPDSVATSGYALGIESGQQMEAVFNEAVTKATNWSAPLNIQVTYQ